MNTIAVIGSGTMGTGIAHTFAIKGYQVKLIDISAERLKKGLSSIGRNMERQVTKGILTVEAKEESLNNIKLHTDLESGCAEADLVIEAATENLEVKLQLFRDLDKFCKTEAVLATNTSSISITQIAAVSQRPEKVIGMHFMNPVPLMKLVEVINGYSTSAETTEMIMELSRKIDKIPVMASDYPGFVANRILMPMINEAIETLADGVAGVEEIDTVMKLGMSHPMGPLQLADFIGLDVCLAILKVLHDGFGNPKYAPSPLLVNMVNAGQLGVKTGAGFYIYQGNTKEMKVSAKFK